MGEVTKGKEYMHKARDIRRRIRSLKEQIERDYILAEGVSGIRYDKDKVQTSPVADRMADIVMGIIERTKDLEEEIIALQVYENESREYLLQISEQHERVLTLHYIEGKSWSEVAVKMNYDDKYIYELKNKALAELSEIITDKI